MNEFRNILNLREESTEYVRVLTKFENWIEDNIDPTMIIHESRPHAANSAKYHVYADHVQYN